MNSTSYVVTAARLVRISSLTFAIALMVGFVALQSFASQYGAPHQALVMQTADANPALTAAIAAQQSAGRVCRETPALTDTILFQRLGESKVRVLSFDQAIAASSARKGWIRSYCV
ncbi:MAG: hypothetical protein QOJ72_3019 [Nocardioidaceae bacterium]|jgi:hypothetical protein|nr:hypothetical protein [Nocardioidaceae bacterium]